jgi:hypothetical protein
MTLLRSKGLRKRLKRRGGFLFRDCLRYRFSDALAEASPLLDRIEVGDLDRSTVFEDLEVVDRKTGYPRAFAIGDVDVYIHQIDI